MPAASSPSPVAAPRWLVIVGSVAIVLHLGAILARVLAAQSGPWPQTPGPVDPPKFASQIDKEATTNYLKAIHLTHNYHFPSNRAMTHEAYAEIKLKDRDGNEITTVRLPDPSANAWVRHRQALLIHELGPDQPVPPPPSEEIAAPGKEPPTEQLWSMGEDGVLQLRTVPRHLVPRDGQAMQPLEFSKIVARSLVRSLCGKSGAASAEVLRYTREPVPPPLDAGAQVPDAAFRELISNYGEIRP